MAFANMGAMVGPAIGPVLGGVLSQYLGWKWIFWFLAIVAVLFFLFMLITYPETARNVVGNGSIQPSLWGMSLLNYLHFRKMERGLGTEERVLSRQRSREARSELTGKRRLRWPNPLGAIHIILEKHSGLILLYNSLLYTAFYTVISSAPIMFHETYGFNDLQIGRPHP